MTRIVIFILLMGSAFFSNSILSAKHVLESKGRHQSCLLVAKGKQFLVGFTSNDPVMFSVTYNVNNIDNQLIGQQLTNRFNTTLSAPETAYYCMNWLNNQKNSVAIEWQQRPKQ